MNKVKQREVDTLLTHRKHCLDLLKTFTLYWVSWQLETSCCYVSCNILKCVVSPSLLQPSWISVDFDNWRDWENELEDGKEEFDMYADVSKWHLSSRSTQFWFDELFYIVFLRVFLGACVRIWVFSFSFQMIKEMSTKNKGEAPDMDDLDVSEVV